MTSTPLAAGSHTFLTIENFEILGTFVQDYLIPDLLNDRFCAIWYHERLPSMRDTNLWTEFYKNF